MEECLGEGTSGKPDRDYNILAIKYKLYFEDEK